MGTPSSPVTNETCIRCFYERLPRPHAARLVIACTLGHVTKNGRSPHTINVGSRAPTGPELHRGGTLLMNRTPRCHSTGSVIHLSAAGYWERRTAASSIWPHFGESRPRTAVPFDQDFTVWMVGRGSRAHRVSCHAHRCDAPGGRAGLTVDAALPDVEPLRLDRGGLYAYAQHRHM